jgi:hypothetical protein
VKLQDLNYVSMEESLVLVLMQLVVLFLGCRYAEFLLHDTPFFRGWKDVGKVITSLLNSNNGGNAFIHSILKLVEKMKNKKLLGDVLVINLKLFNFISLTNGL